MDEEKDVTRLCHALIDAGLFNAPIRLKTISEAVIRAGYRKADEVRRETAKEIYERVDKWLDEIVPHTREETTLICLIGWIKTKFGLEVDE